MRTALPTLSLLLLLACTGQPPPDGGAPAAADEPAQAPRNLLFILVDTLRADHLELYGHTQPVSASLYAWAVGGAVFDRAYSPAPWTKPSVATMLTSRMPSEHGVTGWKRRLREQERTLSEHLHEHGFTSAAWVSHHALVPETTGLAQGFDRYDVSVFEGEDPHKIVTSDEITDAGLGFLADAPAERWMLLLHYFDPHRYYVEHPKWLFGETDAAIYDSEIGYTDAQIGRLLAGFAAGGHAEDTLVVFVADHGEEFRDHGHTGHTVALYEESIRVPLVLRGPGIAPQRVEEPVSLVDLAPTLLDLLDVPIPDSFDGEPIARGEGGFAPVRKHIFSETRREADKRAVIRGDDKLIRDLAPGADSPVQLFDVAVDPRERDDRSAEEPELVAELGAVLDAYEARGDEGEEVDLSATTQALLEQLGYLTDE